MKRISYKKHHFFQFIFILFLQFSGILNQVAAQVLPANFQDQLGSGGWNEVEGFTFDNNGRQYVWERAGRVWIVDTNGVKLPGALIDISPEVGGWRDHGLNGFAIDPNFLTNGFIYLMYTVDRHHLMNFGTGNYNAATNEYFNATIIRVTRYTANSADNFNSVINGSRLVLLGEDKKTGIPLLHESHSGGSLVFGRDGSLLMSTGDGASYNFTDGGGGATYWNQGLIDSIIKPKENIGAFRSQLVDCLAGKILRIDPATGDGLPTNPYYDPGNPRAPKSRVWDVGLRNPFRMTIRPGTGSTDITAGDPGVLYIGDVGWGTWEDLHIAKGPGLNFGWPIYEGLTIHTGYNALATQNLDAPNPLFGIGGCTQQYFTFQQLIKQATLNTNVLFTNPCNVAFQIPATIPVFFHDRPAVDWKHGNQSRTGTWSGNNAAEVDLNNGSSPVPGPSFGGNASVGGVWYTGNAYPFTYQNTYFHGDYGTQWIRNFSFDINNDPDSVRNFETSTGACVFIGFNPRDQQLYYVRFPDQIRRIKYLAAVNNPPTAVAINDTSYGASPLTVNFNGSQSTDPENLTLTYLWTFGDGGTSSLANPQYTYTVVSGIPTSYYAKLKVTDNIGQISYDSVFISVNNTPPVVQITSFSDGDLFSTAGFTNMPLQANVTDLEHVPGQLKYKWQTFLHHNNHEHQEASDTNKITSTLLSPVACNEVFYFRISLTVTDEAGLSTTVSSALYPACDVPVAAFQANSNAICRNGSVQFNDQSTNLPTFWNWSFPGGNPSTSVLKNPIVQYSTSGLKSATLIVTSPIGTDTLTLIDYILVKSLPASNITPAGPTTFCNGGNVLLNANLGSNLSYQWRRDGNIINGANNANFTATKTGMYRVLVTSQFGCTKLSSAIAIVADPPAFITASGPTTFCLGDSVLLTANSGSGYSYQWKLNFNNISGAVNQTIYAKTAGKYSVKVTNLTGCSRVSANTEVIVNCKLQSSSPTDNLFEAQINPNPFQIQALLNITVWHKGKISVSLYNAIGKLMLEIPERVYEAGNYDLILPADNLNSGIYFCKINSPEGNKTIKVIVNK